MPAAQKKKGGLKLRRHVKDAPYYARHFAVAAASKALRALCRARRKAFWKTQPPHNTRHLKRWARRHPNTSEPAPET